MRNWFPVKYDRNWINVWLLSTVVFWVFWNGSRYFILHRIPNSGGLLGILLLSMASSLVFCISGFFGLRILWYFNWIGIGTGLCLNLAFYFRGGGWEDLAGLIAYAEFAILGTVTGIVGEIIYQFLSRRRM